MSDENDLIRRGDALAIFTDWSLGPEEAIAKLRTLPADPVTNEGCCQPMRVKRLVWEEVEEDRGDGRSEHNGGYEADSPLGVYEIAMGFGSDSYYWSVSDPLLNEVGCYEDPSYAKAAAQADYEARILAAIEPAPVTLADALHVPEVQALVEAAVVAKLALAEHEPYPMPACRSLLAALSAIREGEA